VEISDSPIALISSTFTSPPEDFATIEPESLRTIISPPADFASSSPFMSLAIISPPAELNLADPV
jgi:hypothetical protein